MDIDFGHNMLGFINSILKPEDIIETESSMEQIERNCVDFFQGKIGIDQAKINLNAYINDPEKVQHVLDMLKFFSQTLEVNQIQNPRPNQRSKSIPWTQEEDKRLTDAVNANGTNNWGAVASYVGNNRTRSQCSQRWNRVINPQISKENWTEEEEEKLLKIVARVNTKQWTRIASEMGNRCDVQCRFRYNFIMKKRRKAMETTNMLPPDDSLIPN